MRPVALALSSLRPPGHACHGIGGAQVNTGLPPWAMRPFRARPPGHQGQADNVEPLAPLHQRQSAPRRSSSLRSQVDAQRSKAIACTSRSAKISSMSAATCSSPPVRLASSVEGPGGATRHRGHGHGGHGLQALLWCPEVGLHLPHAINWAHHDKGGEVSAGAGPGQRIRGRQIGMTRSRRTSTRPG